MKQKLTEYYQKYHELFDKGEVFYIHEIMKHGKTIQKTVSSSPDSPFGGTTGLFKYYRTTINPKSNV
jgi:hypothetical protein